MALKRLLIENVRSIKSADLEFSNCTNVITGNNGAGKTSLLEAIHILSLGRSFLTRNYSNVASFGSDRLVVGGTLESRSFSQHTLGVLLSRSNNIYKANHSRVRGISELSSLFPVVVFSPETPQQLLGKSIYRRSFMDWGCFQQEPVFLHSWRVYNQALKQRNAALRSHSPRGVVEVWNSHLVAAASKITEFRKAYLLKSQEKLGVLQSSLDLPIQLDLSFRRGWKGSGLDQVLYDTFSNDAKRGFTQHGSHRDDFDIKLDGRPINQVGSRGQKKLAVFLLKLLQTDIAQSQSTDVGVTLLMDDLPSEFDSHYLNLCFKAAQDIGSQLFISAVNPISTEALSAGSPKMFHVKHGAIAES